MIQLRKGQTENVILTLTEKQTLIAPNYLFRFVHRATNREVKFVLLWAANTSPHKIRYDQFEIVVNTHFANCESGQWDYFIYEQVSSTNTDPVLANNMLECGIMQLADATDFTYTSHNPSNQFITR